MSSRSALVVTTVALAAVLAVAAALLIPWRPLPLHGLAPSPVDAARDFSAAQIARENAFHAAVRPPAYASLALGLLIAAVLGFTPLGARLVSAVAAPFGGGWFARVVVGTVALTLLGRALTLPWDAWSESVRRRYGLSTRGWGSWGLDVAKAYGVGLVLTLVVLLLLVGLAHWQPERWWAVGAAVGALLVVVVSFAYPVVVEPVFNKFTSMEAGPLRTSLLQLAREDGVPVDDVLVADASRRTSSLNAYVSGIGATRRIVVYDTLVDTASPEQVRLIVAHELGHAKERDVVWGTLLGATRRGAGRLRARAARPVGLVARAGRCRLPRRRPRGGAADGTGGGARLRGRAGAEPDVATGRDPGRRARPGPDPRPGGRWWRCSAGCRRPICPTSTRRHWSSGCSRRTPPARSGSRWRATGPGCTDVPVPPGLPRVTRTLVITNDFPPRVGGIESFVLAMVQRMDPASVVVHTARQPGDAAFDAGLDFPVVRDPSRIMLPTPAITTRSVGDRAGHGLRLGVVRRGRAAGTDGLGVEAAGRRTSDRGDDARARGVVGEGAGDPAAAAPDRRDQRRAHLPRRVHAVAGRARPVAGGRGADGAADAGRRHRGLPPVGRRPAGAGHVRPGRPPGGRVRLTARRAQGPGHAGPGAAAGAASRCPTRPCCSSATVRCARRSYGSLPSWA